MPIEQVLQSYKTKQMRRDKKINNEEIQCHIQNQPLRIFTTSNMQFTFKFSGDIQ